MTIVCGVLPVSSIVFDAYLLTLFKGQTTSSAPITRCCTTALVIECDLGGKKRFPQSQSLSAQTPVKFCTLMNKAFL